MKFLLFLLPALLFCDAPIPQDAILAENLHAIVLKNDKSSSPYLINDGIQIHNLKLPGPFDELKMGLLPYLGKPLTLHEIEKIKKSISTYYQTNDHPLLTVGVPDQDVTDGILQLVVIESSLGEISFSGNRWFSDSLLNKSIRLEPGEPVISSTLIEDIAWLNRNPFRSTDVIFAPGVTPHTTDIEFVTHDRFPVRIYGGGDNTGTKITGRARWFAGLDWAWTHFFDQILSYQFTTSSNVKELLSHTGHYTAFLPWRHVFILYGGYASTKPDITHFHSDGYNAQGSLRYQIPITLFPSPFYLQPTFGLDYKLEKTSLIFAGDNDIFISGGLAAVSQIMLGSELAWEKRDHKVLFQWLCFWSPGNIFPHQSIADYNSLRIGAVPSYLYSTMTLSYRYKNPYCTLWVQGRGQKATKPLLQSEEFPLGGYDTVRGYDEREFLADNGLCFNLELKSPTWSFFRCRKVKDEWTFLTFFDYGLGVNQIKIQDEQHSAFLLSVGPGVRLSVSPYFTFRCDYGFKLHKLHFGDSSLGKLHLGGILSY